MSAKEREALFNRALSLHQAGTPSDLRAALSLYESALTQCAPTLPLAFNAGAAALSLSSVEPDPPAAAALRASAIRLLDSALALAPENLEALVARSAVEDASVRAGAPALPGRHAAVRFLRDGTVAELRDHAVRVLLAEALVVYAEVLSEVSGSKEAVVDALGEARRASREAVWLLREREGELSRMATDAGALERTRTEIHGVRVVDGKVALAEHRLVGGGMGRVREAEAALAGCPEGEALMVRAELLECLAEEEGRAALERGAEVCSRAVAALEGVAEKGRWVGAMTLLGDFCLALARGEAGIAWAGRVFEVGLTGYKGAIRASEGDREVGVEGETYYNMACLMAVGARKGLAGVEGRRVAELLKKAVDEGVVNAGELRADEDLVAVHGETWFAKLLEYAERTKPR